MMHTALKIAMIALAATIVESLPITDTFDDNVTVPLTCVAVGSLLFPA
jgi:phytol kinase